MQQQAAARDVRAAGRKPERAATSGPFAASQSVSAAALQRMAAAADASPPVAAQRAAAAALHGSPQVTAQRALAQRMQMGAAQSREATQEPVQAGSPPAQRLIGFEHDHEGKVYAPNRNMTAEAVLAELDRYYDIEESEPLNAMLADFDRRNAIFWDFRELIQVLTDRGALVREDTSDDDEEADDAGFTSFFHGTDLETARLLVGGVKIDARGKGELGGGFYMTHDLHQAAHIADYYTGKEGRGPQWAVVQFDIPNAALQGPLANRQVVTPDEFRAYYESVQAESNVKESPYDWTIGPIKDAKTPYVQHLFASGGLAALNDRATTRALVLSGVIGIEKAKYLAQVADYDPDADERLMAFLSMEPEAVKGGDDDADDDDDSGVDYDELAERVASALRANNKRLTRNVIGELEEALESKPGDPRLLAWLASLQ